MKHQNLITAAVLGMMSAAVVASPVSNSGSYLPAEEKEGCKGKDGCNGKKKEEKKEEEKKEGTVLLNASVTPEDKDKDSCKGKDGCNGKKKEEEKEKKDGTIL